MAITYVGGVNAAGRTGNSNATTTQSLTSLAGGSGTQPAEGDLVIVCCAVGSQGRNTAQAISGYTTLGTQLNASAVTYDTSMQVSWKVMTATPDTSITIPAQGNIADGQAWAVMVFRGVDTATPFDVSSVSNTGTGTGRPTPPAITPTTSGAWIIEAAAAAAAATTTAFTAQTDFSDDFVQGTGADTNDCRACMGYHDGWTSGQYTPGQITGGTTGANDSWAAWTMALRPARDPVTPSVGSSAFTGYVPSVALALVAAASIGSASFTGYEPTASVGTTVSPSDGATTLTGYQPTLSVTTGVDVNAWFLRTLDGAENWAKIDETGFVKPSVGSLVATGYQPDPLVSSGQTATPLVGALTLAGYQPTPTQNVVPAPLVGSLTLTGYQPSPTQQVSTSPSVGSLDLTGYQPTSTQSVNSAPSVGSLSFTGYAPTLTQSALATPSVGAVSIQGYEPDSVLSGAIVPFVGALSLTGYQPTAILAVNVSPSVGSLSLAGYEPAVSQAVFSAPSDGALTFTGYQPFLGASGTVYPLAGSIEFVGYSPTADTGAAASWFLRDDWASLTGTGAFISQPTDGSLSLTGYQLPTSEVTGVDANAWFPIETDGANTWQGGYLDSTAVLTLTGYAPAVIRTTEDLGWDELVSGAATIYGEGSKNAIYDPQFSRPSVGSISFTGYTPDVYKTAFPTQGGLSLTGEQPLVRVEAAEAITINVAFPFASSAQGFTSVAGAGTTMAWTGADGNPAGSLQTRTTGRNRVSTNTWTLNTTWQDLGVPLGHVVTAITAKSAQSRCTEYSTALSGTVAAVTLSTPISAPITLAASRTYTAAEGAWVGSTSADSTGLEIASESAVTITLGTTTRTGNSNSAAVTVRQDNVSFTVSYVPAKVALPTGSELSFTGYQPTLDNPLALVAYPETGAITFAGETPEVGRDYISEPATGALALTGYDPLVNLTVYPSTGTAEFTGYDVVVNKSVAPLTGALTFTGEVPLVPSFAAPETGALAFTGNATNVLRNITGSGLLIARRAFIEVYFDQFGAAVMAAGPATVTADTYRDSYGDGTLVSGSATLSHRNWEFPDQAGETWTEAPTDIEGWAEQSSALEEWLDIYADILLTESGEPLITEGAEYIAVGDAGPTEVWDCQTSSNEQWTVVR